VKPLGDGHWDRTVDKRDAEALSHAWSDDASPGAIGRRERNQSRGLDGASAHGWVKLH